MLRNFNNFIRVSAWKYVLPWYIHITSFWGQAGGILGDNKECASIMTRWCNHD